MNGCILLPRMGKRDTRRYNRPPTGRHRLGD
jgi:hypothetical protein